MHDRLLGPSSGEAFATERRNPRSAEIDGLTPLAIARLMNDEDATVAAAVAAELPRIAAAIEGIAARLREGGRLIYLGAGTSGRLGVLDATECPPTFNTPPGLVVGLIAGGPAAVTGAVEEAEDRPEVGQADLAQIGVSAKDAVVGIAASGSTPYVLGGVRFARSSGALTVGLACNPDTPLAALVQIMITPVVGPEVITGSTRLKAGTAQKMVLNMLSTGTMILLGKTYGNLMVDLRATNAKLRRRAGTIVQQATGLSETAAAEALAAADGDVKTAIIAVRTGLDPATARARLAQHGGHLRPALEDPAP